MTLTNWARRLSMQYSLGRFRRDNHRCRHKSPSPVGNEPPHKHQHNREHPYQPPHKHQLSNRDNNLYPSCAHRQIPRQGQLLNPSSRQFPVLNQRPFLLLRLWICLEFHWNTAIWCRSLRHNIHRLLHRHRRHCHLISMQSNPCARLSLVSHHVDTNPHHQSILVCHRQDTMTITICCQDRLMTISFQTACVNSRHQQMQMDFNSGRELTDST